MREFSLVFAATVMAAGLAVSGGASAEDMPTNYEVLTRGEILMKSDIKAGHVFTVNYHGAIYGSILAKGEKLMCAKAKGNNEKAMSQPPE